MSAIAPRSARVRRVVGSTISALALTLGVALVGPPAARAAEVEITLQDRAPLAFLLVNPSGAAAQVRTSFVINLVSDLFERHTDLEVRLVDPQSVADCRGRLPCMVRVVRTDYDRDRLIGPRGIVPFSEHQARIEAERLEVPRALFVLSSVAFGDKDRLIPQWVDTDEALALQHEADRSAPDWQSDVEARVREYAIPVTLPSAAVQSEAEARAFLERLVTEHLRPELERSTHWEPYGSVTLQDTPEGAAIRFDGRTLGTTRSGDLLVRQVRPGPHTVELARAGYDPWSSRFELARGAHVVLEPRLSAIRSSHPGRVALLWGGAAVGAAGIAISAWAIAAQPSDTIAYCSAPCGDRFVTAGEDTTRTPAFGSTGGDVLLAPLGYSLALTGVAWSLGSAFIGEQDDFPWWSAVGGLVIGGVAYGLSAALDPGPP